MHWSAFAFLLLDISNVNRVGLYTLDKSAKVYALLFGQFLVILGISRF